MKVKIESKDTMEWTNGITMAEILDPCGTAKSKEEAVLHANRVYSFMLENWPNEQDLAPMALNNIMYWLDRNSVNCDLYKDISVDEVLKCT